MSQIYVRFVSMIADIPTFMFHSQRGNGAQDAVAKAGSRVQEQPICFLICFARQVEVRENAVHVRRHDLARRADVGFVELVIAVDTEQRQADADLVLKDLEQPDDPGSAGGGEAVDIKSAKRDDVSPEDQRLGDIGAAINAAVDDDAGAAADGFDDFRQDVNRADALIELAPAMV